MPDMAVCQKIGKILAGYQIQGLNKMHECYFHLNNDCYFMAHSELRASRPTLLFIHGLGDAHIHTLPYLSTNLSEHYNILIPDLLGHGKSSSAEDYSFQHQTDGIVAQITYLQERLGIQLTNFILIAHSMGGIHATLLCESKLKKHIKAFINVEGSITQFGSFIATNMVNSIKTESFISWFNNFKQKKVYETLGFQSPSVRPYYAALEFCKPEAFLNNAIQMHEMSTALAGKYTNIIGEKYSELTIDKVYCHGDTAPKETIEFLNEHQLKSKHFSCKNHFLLAECLEEFVCFIHSHVKSL